MKIRKDSPGQMRKIHWNIWNSHKNDKWNSKSGINRISGCDSSTATGKIQEIYSCMISCPRGFVPMESFPTKVLCKIRRCLQFFPSQCRRSCGFHEYDQKCDCQISLCWALLRSHRESDISSELGQHKWIYSGKNNKRWSTGRDGTISDRNRTDDSCSCSSAWSDCVRKRCWWSSRSFWSTLLSVP